MDESFALLCACAVPADAPAANDRVRAAVAGRHDWPGVLGAAADHGLVPLVCRRVLDAAADLLDADAQAQLAAAARASAVRGLAATRQLAGVIAVLARAGVSALPYKGPALAVDAFGSAELRASEDLDIVVAPADLAAAAAALARQGYEPIGSLTWPDARRVHDWQGHVPLTGGPHSLPVELHWRFCDRKLPWNPDVASVLGRAGRREIGGVSMRIPDRCDQLLLVLLHSARHGWDRLEGLACTAALLGRGADGETLLARASQVGGRRAVLAGLALAQRMLVIPLPASLAGAIREDRVLPDLLRTAESRLRAGDAGTARDPRVHLAALDGAVARARYLALNVLLPTPQDRDSIDLPRLLAPLYVGVRAVRLMGRALRR